MSQPEFTTALLDPGQPAPAGLQDAEGRPAVKRFDVYRNNVAVSLREALETGFPATARLLGEANFNAIAGAYLRKSPPASPLMILYGQGFPAAIEAIPALQKLAYLPDVARLEYAIRQSYHAADAPVLDPQRLAELTPEALNGARLQFAPATRLLQSNWPVLSIRAKALGEEVVPAAQPEPVLITRPDYDPELTVLTPEQATMLAQLMAGATLAAASAQHPEADLGALLAILLTTQALTDILVEDNS